MATPSCRQTTSATTEPEASAHVATRVCIAAPHGGEGNVHGPIENEYAVQIGGAGKRRRPTETLMTFLDADKKKLLGGASCKYVGRGKVWSQLFEVNDTKDENQEPRSDPSITVGGAMAEARTVIG